MLSLRVELKTSRLLNGCSNQLSYESCMLRAVAKGIVANKQLCWSKIQTEKDDHRGIIIICKIVKWYDKFLDESIFLFSILQLFFLGIDSFFIV